MITREEITLIGKFNKAHGINGEISATINAPLDVMKDCSCIVCDIDGIYVPFFINAVRRKSQESILISIDDINSEQEAMMLVNRDIYALNTDYTEAVADDDEIPVNFLVNFKVTINNALNGRVTDIDDSTANVLFVITLDNGSEILIPAVDEFITDIDLDNKTMEFVVPQDLLDL